MSDGQRIETPEVSFSLSGAELTLRDEAGGGELVVEFDSEPSLTRATTSWFDVPMDGAISFETEEFRIPRNIAVWLRDADGESYGLLTEQETSVDGKGTFIEVSAAMKIVAYVESGPVRGRLCGDSTAETAVVSFDEPTQVVLGARSVHEQPTATMTVPDDPEALMEAVSYLGTSIKEWSAERSWPTLRGYPPEIEMGEQLSIPDRLTKPDTGVTVAVSPRPEDILRVAPLAHYFGAEIVPGERPELRICGHAESLGTGEELERSVDELLARGLVLDSLVRIGGYYSMPRYEYEELAPELPFYPPELYDESIDRQLLEYLEVPFEQIEPHVPRWSATTTLRPSVREATALPYLLNSFSRVHVTEDGMPRVGSRDSSVVNLSTVSAVPGGVASLSTQGREKAIAHERSKPGQASVTIIGMDEPGHSCFSQANWGSYEIDDGVPSPEYHSSVTSEELKTAFRANPLYLHYGNGTTREGFVCTDGILRFDEVPSAEVGVVSFDWNSPETAQLEPLLTAATVAFPCQGPIRPTASQAFAKYLVLGYPPVEAARYVGFDETFRFVGDASLSLTDHANGVTPGVLDVQAEEEGRYRLTFNCRRTQIDDLGTVLQWEPEKYSETYRLLGSSYMVDYLASKRDLVDIAEGDHLLRFECEPPDEVPKESILHVSREGWLYGRGGDAHKARQTDSGSRR